MSAILPDTILQRAENLSLYFTAGWQVRIHRTGRDLFCDDSVLRILDAFAQPTTLADGLARLQYGDASSVGWMQISSTVMRLIRFGALRDTAQPQADVSAPRRGFDSPAEQIAMLNDRARTDSYRQAIADVVRPGDVVIDLGTGTGILAAAAVQAGARHVYAIESGRIADSAQALFAANGLADRITLVRGWSTRVTLPERADVLVTETVGNEPLGEHIIEFSADARRRFLKPDARLIPGSIRVWGVPLAVPEDIRARYQYTSAVVQNWSNWYDLDYAPLLNTGNPGLQSFMIAPHQVVQWPIVGDPVVLLDIDLTTQEQFVLQNNATLAIGTSGMFSGIGVYFDLQLSPGVSLGTDPRRTGSDCSWRMPIWLLPTALPVTNGDVFEVTYRHGGSRAAQRLSLAK